MAKQQIEEAEVMESRELAVTLKPGKPIATDWTHIDKKIADVLELYGGVTVELSYLKQAKNDRAFLNALVASVEQKRKDAKAAYMEAYLAFEAEVKEHLAPVREASAAIDRQIKDLEAIERQEKRDNLAAYWEGCAGALAEVVPFSRILDDKWLNKSVSTRSVMEEMDKLVERIATDDQTLDSLQLSHHIEAKAEYFATLDLSKAIARSKQLDEQEEAARRLEEIKNENIAALQEPGYTVGVDTASGPDQCVVAPVAPQPIEELSDRVSTFHFEIECTPKQRDEIIAFLKARNIKGKAVG